MKADLLLCLLHGSSLRLYAMSSTCTIFMDVCTYVCIHVDT